MTEFDYYKQLAHLWEKACHDIKAQRPPRSDTPFSYAAAVTFANENIVSIKPVDPAEEAKGIDVAPMRTITEEQILAIPGVRAATEEDLEKATPGHLERQAEAMAQDIDRQIVDEMIVKFELKNAAAAADKKLLEDINQRLAEYSNELADIGAEHIKAVLAENQRVVELVDAGMPIKGISKQTDVEAPVSGIMKAKRRFLDQIADIKVGDQPPTEEVSEVSMGCRVPTPDPCTICGDPNDQKLCKHVTGPLPPDDPKCIRCGVGREYSKRHGGLRGMSCATTACTYPDYVKPNIENVRQFSVTALFKGPVCTCGCPESAHHSEPSTPPNQGCVSCEDCLVFTHDKEAPVELNRYRHLGAISVVPEGTINPYAVSISGPERSEALGKFLTGKPTPGYEFWHAEAGGGARQLVDAADANVDPDTIDFYWGEDG